MVQVRENKKSEVHRMTKDNVRRFTFRLYLMDGRQIDVVRECDRPIPPTKEWVMKDQHSLMTAPYTNGWAHFTATNGNLVTVQMMHVVNVELIDIKEGLNLSELRERYNLK